MLRLLDGFDHYETANILRKNAIKPHAGTLVGSTYRRGASGQGMLLASGAVFQTIGQGAIGKNVPTNSSWGFFGTAWQQPTLQGSGYVCAHAVYDIAVSALMHLCSFVGADGSVSIGWIEVNNFSTVANILVSSVPGLIVSGASQYIETGFKINNTTGGCIVRVDGVVAVSYTGNTRRGSGNIDTASTNNRFTQVRMGGLASGGGADIWIDDFYYADDTGTRNNDFVGDLSIYTLYSNATGDVSDWTRTGAASDILAVNEHPAIDDDAGYLASRTVGQKFLHNLDGITATSGIVVGAAVNHMIRKDDSGSREVKSLLKASGVEASGTSVATPSSNANQQSIYETSPATGVPLTLAEVASLQTGAEVTV